MNLAEMTLRQDVQNFYSNTEKTTASCQKEYDFEGNKVAIVFNRVWEGKSICCGIDMYGSANITMTHRNGILEELISKIIKTPTYRSMVGISPIVNEINFN